MPGPPPPPPPVVAMSANQQNARSNLLSSIQSKNPMGGLRKVPDSEKNDRSAVQVSNQKPSSNSSSSRPGSGGQALGGLFAGGMPQLKPAGSGGIKGRTPQQSRPAIPPQPPSMRHTAPPPAPRIPNSNGISRQPSAPSYHNPPSYSTSAAPVPPAPTQPAPVLPGSATHAPGLPGSAPRPSSSRGRPPPPPPRVMDRTNSPQPRPRISAPPPVPPMNNTPINQPPPPIAPPAAPTVAPPVGLPPQPGHSATQSRPPPPRRPPSTVESFESRFSFPGLNELPQPEIFDNTPRSYPSKTHHWPGQNGAVKLPRRVTISSGNKSRPAVQPPPRSTSLCRMGDSARKHMQAPGNPAPTAPSRPNGAPPPPPS